jgi:hypothetical protein
MNNYILEIPIKYRINNALQRIPKEYGINQNSNYLDILKYNSGDVIIDDNGISKIFPDINSVRYTKGEIDPIYYIYHILWYKHGISRLAFIDYKKKSEIHVFEKGPKFKTNGLLIRKYGNTKQYSYPSHCIDLKDYNHVKAIKLSKNVDEQDVAMYTAIRAVKEYTGIDITKIPNCLGRIIFVGSKKVNDFLNYRFILALSSTEYKKYIINTLDNVNEDFFYKISPEVSEIKYKYEHTGN